jgi:hypothetical protein
LAIPWRSASKRLTLTTGLVGGDRVADWLARVGGISHTCRIAAKRLRHDARADSKPSLPPVIATRANVGTRGGNGVTYLIAARWLPSTSVAICG